MAEKHDIKLDTSRYFVEFIQGARNFFKVCWTKCQAILDIFYIDRMVSKTGVHPIFPHSQGIIWPLIGIICSHWNYSHFYSCWTLCVVTNNNSAELAEHVRQNLEKSESFCKLCT